MSFKKIPEAKKAGEVQASTAAGKTKKNSKNQPNKKTQTTLNNLMS